MVNRILISLLLMTALRAQTTDSEPGLLDAARRGRTVHLGALLDKGASLEAKDKDGRTALMLAAQHGHADTVSLLLSKGALPDVRDREGLNAYGLAFLSTAKGREKVLSLLPAPARVRVVLDIASVLDKAYNSCFMTPPQLAERLREVRPDALVARAVREFAGVGNSLLDLVAADGDAVLSLRVRPEAMCVQQESSDNLQMQVDVRLMLSGSEAAIWEKTVGGGLKGLKARVATNPVQYLSVYEEWAKAEAEPIYAGLVAALLKSGR